MSENAEQESSFAAVEIEFRSAGEADAESLARLVAENGFGYPTEISLVRERLKDLIAAGDCVLVAARDSQIIGMILLHRTRFLHRPPDGRISALVVSENYRNLSVGAQLVSKAEEIFRSWNCGRIEVSSGIKREAAHRFYIRAGFSEAPKRFIKNL